MVVSFVVAWNVLWPSCLVLWVGFCLVVLVLTCPGQGILLGISVLMVLSQDHWNPVIINALRLFVGGFWGIPKVQLRRFWMAHSSSDTVPLILPCDFTHGLYAGLEMVVVNDGMLLLVMCLMIEVTLLKGSG